jgi:hypothetical protein
MRFLMLRGLVTSGCAAILILAHAVAAAGTVTYDVAGDFNGWDLAGNAAAATAMTPLGDVYGYEQVLSPGTYQDEAVDTGSWDAIGVDAQGVDSSILGFTTTTTDPPAVSQVDPVTAAAAADRPEPSSIVLLGVGAVAFATYTWGRRRAKS